MANLALVVDDSLIIRKLVSKTLKEIGYETIDVQNGKEALDAAKKNPTITLIVTDQNMPVMSGIEFIRALRDEPAHKFTPVIFLTTEGVSSLMDEAREAGATAWVMKPFNPEKLLSVVNRINA